MQNKRSLYSLALLSAALFAMASPVFSADWKLVWSDEFNGQGLPDKAKWVYETGFVRNNELQLYTRDRAENARMENGCLVIEGRKEQFPNPAYKPESDPKKKSRRNPQNAEYTSASLTTEGKFAFCYGRVEVRARLPQGKGIWPAIWMLGENHSRIGWPKCGEIDIMEFVGKEPDKIHGTAHYWGGNKHQSKGGKITVQEPFADFHLYAVEWYPDHIDFFFDDRKYFTFKIDEAGEGPENCFRKPHYLLINLALGGAWGGPMDDSVLPQKYLVDYVRVYAGKN